MKKKRNVVCVVSCLLIVLILTSAFAGCVGKTSVVESVESETSAAGMPTVNGENLKELQPVDMPVISTDLQIRNLEKLCKVWGYVKYTHSVFLLGQKDWDEELLKLMPEVASADNEEDVNGILYDWFIKLGEIDYGTSVTVPRWLNAEDSKVVQADTNWISDKEYLGEELSNALVLIQVLPDVNREKAPVFFDELDKTCFSNEKSYELVNYSNNGYRLLGLFRFWNAIEYYFPYLDIMDDDWNELLPMYIAAMANDTGRLSYEKTIMSLATKLKDVHVFLRGNTFLSDEFGEYAAPVRLTNAGGKLVVLEICEDGCLLNPGDVVLKVDGVSIEEVIAEVKKYCPINMEDKILALASYYLLCSKNTPMEITVLRGEEEMDLIVEGSKERYVETVIPENSHELLEHNIGLINPSKLNAGEIDEIMKEYAETDGLIVDMRQYPSTPIMYDLASYFIQIAVPFARFTEPSRAVPGTFLKTSPYRSGNPNMNPNGYLYEKNVVLLMDERTLSQAEFTVMSLRNGPNVIVIGENSAGSDGDVTVLPMSDGMGLSFTGLGVFTSVGGQTQRIGLTPDIYVERTIDGIREGRDEYIEAAVQYILEKNAVEQ